MKNLIGMTDFVLEQNKKGRVYYDDLWNIVINYANFLKQPLKLWIFVPCDENGNVLEKPICQEYALANQKYQQAKERCLFENHDLDIETIKHHINLGRTVEYFDSFETLQLTSTALKQIGL